MSSHLPLQGRASFRPLVYPMIILVGRLFLLPFSRKALSDSASHQFQRFLSCPLSLYIHSNQGSLYWQLPSKKCQLYSLLTALDLACLTKRILTYIYSQFQVLHTGSSFHRYFAHLFPEINVVSRMSSMFLASHSMLLALLPFITLVTVSAPTILWHRDLPASASGHGPGPYTQGSASESSLIFS